MNILVINWRDIKHPLAGGCEVYLHELMKRWNKEGHEITMVSGGYTGLPKRTIIDGIEIIRVGGKYSVYPLAALHLSLIHI